MSHPLPRILPALLLLAILIAPAVPLSAQENPDSLAMARKIAGERPDLLFSGSARMRLLRLLRENDLRETRALMGFMGRRIAADAGTWLSPADRLIVETIIADTSLLRNLPRLRTALRGTAELPKQSSAYQDMFHQQVREILRERVGGIQERFDAAEPPQAERHFFNLLMNHLYVRGYRAQEELNARVDRYVREYGDSPLAQVALLHLKREYAETPFGAAFSAGYGAGEFSGELARRFNYYHGPMIAGEFYIYNVTVAAWMNFGVAKAPVGFTAGGRYWPAGGTSHTSITLDAGYEFRFGRFAVTPLAGLAVQSLRASDTGAADATQLPRTRERIGFDVAAIVGYRLPSDVGPHLDFRFRVGRASTALGSYDAGFDGALWYLQLGFALVQRPYMGR